MGVLLDAVVTVGIVPGTPSLSHTHTLSLSLTHTLSLSHSLSLFLSLSYTHTHTLSLPLPPACSLSRTCSPSSPALRSLQTSRAARVENEPLVKSQTAESNFTFSTFLFQSWSLYSRISRVMKSSNNTEWGRGADLKSFFASSEIPGNFKSGGNT